jgi:aryl-alcohol dehydrogenase-like predicted oxidoreductase
MSTRRLGVDHLDLYYLHSGRATDVPFEDQIGTLADLQSEGLIRHIGLSNVTLEQLKIASGIVEVATVTGHFNLVARNSPMVGVTVPTDLMRSTLEAGAVFVPWQPVSLATPGDPADVEGPEAARSVLSPIAARLGASVPQVTLAWLLWLSPSILPIPGTTSIRHLEENVTAQDLRLTPEDVRAINKIADHDSG